MNHRTTARTSPPSGHPGSVLRRAREACLNSCLFGWLFVLAWVVLVLAGERFEEETNNGGNGDV